MTSVDSGVETGNDSNDSSATVETQAQNAEASVVKASTCTVLSHGRHPHATASADRRVAMHSQDLDNNKNPLFRQPLQKISGPLEVDPPAGLSFLNLQTSSLGLGSGYEVIGNSEQLPSPVPQHELHRRLRGIKCRASRETWLKLKMHLDERRLRQAASTNNVERVASFLEAGVNPNCCDDQQRSPLHLAACRGYSDIVSLLLQHGADPNRRDSLGNTPLHLAACTNNVGVVTLLLKAGTDISSSDHYGRSPLQLAQSKLKLLQRASSEQTKAVKEEVQQVIEMMLTFLHKRGQDEEAELLGAFSSRLTLSSTREEVEIGVKDLLASLANLSIDKTPHSK